MSIVAGNVEAFDFREGTVFYMFNAFGPQTLRRMLAALERSLVDCPRLIRIAYLYPLHDDLLADAPWLQRTGTVSTLEGEASLWSTGG